MTQLDIQKIAKLSLKYQHTSIGKRLANLLMKRVAADPIEKTLSDITARIFECTKLISQLQDYTIKITNHDKEFENVIMTFANNTPAIEAMNAKIKHITQILLQAIKNERPLLISSKTAFLSNFLPPANKIANVLFTKMKVLEILSAQLERALKPYETKPSTILPTLNHEMNLIETTGITIQGYIKDFRERILKIYTAFKSLNKQSSPAVPIETLIKPVIENCNIFFNEYMKYGIAIENISKTIYNDVKRTEAPIPAEFSNLKKQLDQLYFTLQKNGLNGYLHEIIQLLTKISKTSNKSYKKIASPELFVSKRYDDIKLYLNNVSKQFQSLDSFFDMATKSIQNLIQNAKKSNEMTKTIEPIEKLLPILITSENNALTLQQKRIEIMKEMYEKHSISEKEYYKQQQDQKVIKTDNFDLFNKSSMIRMLKSRIK